jgi:hypothetical protein
MGSAVRSFRRSAATLSLCVGALLCQLPGAASAQVYTWTGDSSASQNWSDPANWNPSAVPPSGATLRFPMLSAACSGMAPTEACYMSVDDTGLPVDSITVDSEQNYVFEGQPITLGAGGLTVDPSQGPPAGFDTIALATDQTWRIGGPVGIDQLTGNPHALTVDLRPATRNGSGQVTLVAGDSEVGPVHITGPGIFDFAGNSQIGESELNAHDGEPVTLGGGAALMVESLASPETGPLSSSGATVSVGNGSPATLTVDGSVALPKTALYMNVDAPGPASELTATGKVTLGGTLDLLQDRSHGNTCSTDLKGGTSYTLVSAAGTLTGRFTGLANGAVLGISRLRCGKETAAARIGYTPRSVTATIVPGLSKRQIKAALARVLKPHGRNAAVARLLKNGGYRFSFAAPGTGSLDLSWEGRAHHQPVYVGSADADYVTAAHSTVKLKLTPAGRSLLAHGGRVKLTAEATFTALSGPDTIAHARFALRR